MKFLIDNIFLVGLALVSGGMLVWPVLFRAGKQGSPTEVTLLINRGKTTVIDVREPAEFANGHLRDAKNVPLAELAQRVGEFKTDKAVVLVCQSGARSARAARILAKAGFSDVTNLEGGIAAWQAANLPLVK
ncbi:rhodanese-like domain-containing protein [Massilia sp. TS11]|uniref:rhodanese-like domain-containing protein n=1 Tax=Massilia sp. TS11 TaxID=2908003 RepID=UPI001EDB4E9E|nr:rhodanese-like domain-containing protein [Massilia sp. TS11]